MNTTNKSNEQQKMNKDLRYIFIVGYYFFIAQFLLLLFVVPILNKTMKQSDVSLATDSMMSEVGYDKYGMTFIHENDYTESFVDNYKIYLLNPLETINETIRAEFNYINLGKYFDGFLIINSYNNHFEKLLTDDLSLDIIYIENVLDGKIQTWSNNQKIRIYSADADNLAIPLLDHKELFQNNPYRLVSISNPSYMSVLNFIYFVILIVPMIILLIDDIKYEIKNFKEQSKINILYGFLTLFLGSIILNAISIFIKTNIFDLPLGIAANQRAIESTLVGFQAIFMIVSAVLIGPLVEEIIFRHVMFKLIKNPMFALIASSFIFGLVHVLSEPNITYMIVQGISYIGLGGILGYLYIKNNKNLATIYLIHATYNAFSILITLIN